MTENPVWISEGTAGSTSAAVDVIGRASPEIATTTTADPGAAGTSLAVTLRDRFPQAGNFLIRVEAEEMLVTAGQGTGAGSFTVTRGVNGTSAIAHTAGVTAALVVGVQRVEPVYAKKQITFRGRAGSFSIPGRAGTTGQKLFSIFNAASSNVIVDVEKFVVDLNSTAARIVQPPIVRIYKVTTAPTNGAGATKTSLDSALSGSSASVTMLQDASADATGAATALTIALTTGNFVAQVFPSELYTVAGFAGFDAYTFFPGVEEFVTLNASEGLVVALDYTASAANPTTDRWLVECAWVEYTNA